MLKAKDFRTKAWADLKGKWGTMALCAFIMSIILGACSSFSVVSRFTPPFVGVMFSLVGGVGALLLTGPLTYGMAQLSLNLVRGGEINVNKLFEGFKNFANSLVLYLINTIFIALWSLLLIVPGIIKALSYSMSYYILIDHPELAPNDARKQSMALMNGNKWRLFCLEFSFIGWWLLCVLTLGILSFWITPYQNAAMAEFYHTILEEKANAQSNGENAENAVNSENAPAESGEVFSELSPSNEATEATEEAETAEAAEVQPVEAQPEQEDNGGKEE